MSGCEHEKSAVTSAGDCHRESVEHSVAGDHCGAVTSAPACHTAGAAAEDSCCDTPARRDYFFWTCLVIVAVATIP